MALSQSQIQDILAEYVDGLVQGNLRLEDVLTKYQVEANSDLEALLLLAQALDSVLVRVNPSNEFVERLRHDLMGDAQAITVLQTLRQLHLSNRQIAAGIGGLTVAAGMLWWARRSGLELLLRRGAAPAPTEAAALAS